MRYLLVVFASQGVIDVLNRKFIRPQSSDPEEYSIFKSEFDLLVSHVAFSENCVMLWKKPFPEVHSDWKHVDRRYTTYGEVRKPTTFGHLFKGTRRDRQRNWELPRGKRSFFKGWAHYLKRMVVDIV
jgi:hypothetical protein